MKRITFYLLFAFIICLSTCGFAYSQNVNRISGKCFGTLLYSYIEIERLGDINAVPCSGKTFNINGVPIPTASGTTNYFPIFSGTSTLVNSDFYKEPIEGRTYLNYSQATGNQEAYIELNADTDGSGNSGIDIIAGGIPNTNSILLFGNGTTGFGDIFVKTKFDLNSDHMQFRDYNAAMPFGMEIKPITAGVFSVGDCFTAPITNCFSITQASNEITVSTLTFQAGNLTSSDNGLIFTIDDGAETFRFDSDGATAVFNVQGVGNYLYNRTITPSGTTGNQAIDSPVGTVNFAALATQVTVTSSIVNADSQIFLTIQSVDATCTSAVVNNKTGGSFRINVNAACTDETSVAFLVTN